MIERTNYYQSSYQMNKLRSLKNSGSNLKQIKKILLIGTILLLVSPIKSNAQVVILPSPTATLPFLNLGTGTSDGQHLVNAQFSSNSDIQAIFWNLSTGSTAAMELGIKTDTSRINISTEGINSSDAFGAQRAQIYAATGSGASGKSGIDLVSCEAATPALCFTRFITNGLGTSFIRATIDVNGLTLNNGTSIQATSTTGLAVANVGANSCGTTAATIAGSNFFPIITVGATSGTQCRITFSFAATTEWNCVANDNTTTIAVRTTPVDTTHTDILGAFVAGDKVTAACVAR